MGPTWRIDDDGHWVLPERTLGWDVLGWAGTALALNGEPLRYTLEQARLLLWWFAIDEAGRWLFTDGVIQRMKGWGKDPVGATLCAAELVGPCRFAGWAEDGSPIATDEPNAWVQTAAVAIEQTKNTMRLMPGLFTEATRAAYGIQVGKELVHADADMKLLQAVTSAPRTLEGARTTFMLMNETQHWLASNDGHEMAAVIDRNATKSAGGRARRLRITNAYGPSEDSVAQRDREAWEKSEAGESLTTGIFYDSLEAPPEAPLTAEAAREVVLGVRGDSVWIDPDTVVRSILDTRNPPSRSRRFWYNQITATEDAWVSPQEWAACAIDRHDDVEPIGDGDDVVLFFDGSKSQDATALIGCRVADGHVFTVGIWEPDPRDSDDVVDVFDVDWTVRGAFERWRVLGFFADVREWESFTKVDWPEAWKDSLKVWAQPSGKSAEAIAWDMRNHVRDFTLAAELCEAEIREGQFTHDGNPVLARQVLNAQRRPNRHGISVGKESRGSLRKIDAAVCVIGARMVRRQLLASGKYRPRRERQRSKVVVLT